MEASNRLQLTKGTGWAEVLLPFPGQHFTHTRITAAPHAPRLRTSGFKTVYLIPRLSLISLMGAAHGRGLRDEGALPPAGFGASRGRFGQRPARFKLGTASGPLPAVIHTPSLYRARCLLRSRLRTRLISPSGK